MLCAVALFVFAAPGCNEARSVERTSVDRCYECHGDPANGNNAPQPSFWRDPQVEDAHQAHLAQSNWRAEIVCEQCHTVPTFTRQAGHLDSELPAELVFDALARADDAAPRWNGVACSGVYCHGATLLPGGSNIEPSWTTVDGTQAACGTCHGLPPDAPHPRLANAVCDPCHPFDGQVPKEPAKHINGVVEVAGCGACHLIPPQTGAHLAHFGDTSGPPNGPPPADYGDTRTVTEFHPAGAPFYMFGCGTCHPLDAAKHLNGSVDVELYDANAPAGSMKALSPPTASFDGQTCSDVYCHSTGQQTPTYVTTPPWQAGELPEPRCSACHDNPPAYESGGAGTDTANTHLVMADDGYEFGHFGGLPGAWHTSFHGRTDESAAPITCQTCHYATVDPDNVGPGGFYYLDTTGDYDLGGMLGYSCLDCHTGELDAPAKAAGAVLTARHVNGTRDVVFDARTSIPAGVGGLPAPPDRPTYPYWVTAAPLGMPPNSTQDGATWSLHLEDSAYDPATKSCTSVPCHLRQSWGPPGMEVPLVWGTVPVGMATCNACHQF